MLPLSSRKLALPSAAAVGFALQLLAAPSAAHIELQLPLNRYSNIRAGENKACPCGSGTTSRRCNDPEEFSDDDRSLDRITTFAPGATISVRFEEYVGHDGRIRIAFDPDGADLEDFNQHILLDEPDPRGNTGNIGEGSIWQFQVTLPDMTCDNCTLQLIQVMDGNTEERVLDPSTRGGTYFQCADLVLAAGTPAGGIAPLNPSEHLAVRRRAEPAPAPATDEPEQPAPAEMTASAPGMAVSDGAGQPGPAASADAALEPMATPDGAESACTLAPGGGARGGMGLAGWAVAVVALGSRRRRR